MLLFWKWFIPFIHSFIGLLEKPFNLSIITFHQFLFSDNFLHSSRIFRKSVVAYFSIFVPPILIIRVAIVLHFFWQNTGRSNSAGRVRSIFILTFDIHASSLWYSKTKAFSSNCQNNHFFDSNWNHLPLPSTISIFTFWLHYMSIPINMSILRFRLYY